MQCLQGGGYCQKFYCNLLFGEPVLVLGQRVIYTLCGHVTCNDRHMKDPFEAGMINLSELYIVLGCEHRKECCDYCGKLNYKAKGLRCANCLTKLYCGVECQVKDTYHLQIKCERGEMRKKKRSDASRKKEGVTLARESLGKLNVDN